MTSIIVSATDDEIYETIGRKAASVLGYRFVGPGLLQQVAEQQQIPPDKLARALDPSSFRRLSAKTRRLLLAQIEMATLEELRTDNVVCAGLGAHLYVGEVSHVLMVRILSSESARMGIIAIEKTKGSLRKARKLLERQREQQRRWSVDCFGRDDGDPSNYDMVLSLGQIEAGKVVSIIKDMASSRKFKPMTYSRKCLEDLALASRAKVALLPRFSESRVRADGDTLIVRVQCPRRHKVRCAEEVKQLVGGLPGVNLVQVHAVSQARELDAA